jgi:hypothetical protein
MQYFIYDSINELVSPSISQSINQSVYQSIHPSIQSAVLLLLPFIFSSGGKVNAKGRKASRAEAATKFILLCNSLADGEEIIQQQRKQSKKQSIQPLVIALGNNWLAVTSAYV